MTPPVTLAVTGSHRENERHHATQGASSLLGLPEPAATPMTKSGRRHSAMGSRPLRRWPDVPPPGRVRQTNLPASHDGGCQVSATTEADRPTATGYGGGGVRVIHASIHAKGKKVENQLNARAVAWGTLYSQPYGDNAIRKTRHKATSPKAISTSRHPIHLPGARLGLGCPLPEDGPGTPFPFTGSLWQYWAM